MSCLGYNRKQESISTDRNTNKVKIESVKGLAGGCLTVSKVDISEITPKLLRF